MKLFHNLPLKLIAATVAATSVFVNLNTPEAIADEIPKTVSESDNYLRLLSVSASEITVGTRDTRYFFTINIPKSSRPLKKVSISQRRGVEPIKFKRRKVRAFGSRESQQRLKISDVDIDRNPQKLTVTFDPPVQPGQILTVVVRVNENPQSDGNYFFDVAVYPQGESGSMSLGVGRLRITSIR
ncbi:MAG: DUF2808 domain-containing protein [Nostocaceae cyanobacterium]|nr:DUF2808 domain-containing protein [Nostocaceae cyanobacterium]